MLTSVLTKLFFPVEPEVAHNNDDLADKGNPEERKSHGTPWILIWECCKLIKDDINLPFRPSEKSHLAASGKTEPGPIRLGAVARATITQTEPIIWENAKVAQT